jgi:hypothetical protein
MTVHPVVEQATNCHTSPLLSLDNKNETPKIPLQAEKRRIGV